MVADNSIVQTAEKEVQTLADDGANSVNSSIRYAAYGNRIRTVLTASSRYIAYVRTRTSFSYRRTSP
jgi:mitochondrial fission process protein 1